MHNSGDTMELKRADLVFLHFKNKYMGYWASSINGI